MTARRRFVQRSEFEAAKTEVQASVARCLRTPPEAAKPQGLISVRALPLGSESNRSIVVVGNYMMARYRRYHPGQKRTLYTLVDPISPPAEAALAIPRSLVEAPGTAPGSDGFIVMAVYRHSRR